MMEYIPEQNLIKLCVAVGSERGYHYYFSCSSCSHEYKVLTSDGRYGNLGQFQCPNCGAEYFASIDDYGTNPNLYVAKLGEQPASYLDSEGKKRSTVIQNDGMGWH